MTEEGRMEGPVVIPELGMRAAGVRGHVSDRSPAGTVPRLAGHVAEYENGLRAGRFEDYFGKEIGPRDLCRLHGIADRASGAAS